MQVFSWENVKKEVLNAKLARKVISGEKITLAQIFLAKDAVVPLHHHENEQFSSVLTGAVRFELEGKELVLRAGEVLHIPSSVPHRVVALEDSLALDVFSPIRTDWLTGKDDYLRR
ncbi:MAG: cupin domain-containing protein [Dehalococcoidales bacterium]|jgi:quercetin dioxygenase-like cupin family protein